MIQLLALSLLCSGIVINAQPVAQKRPAINYAAEARRLVHQTNWAAAATISTLKELEGFPMASVLSTADSKVDSPSSGEIFFYMIGMDLSALDTQKDNKITFLFTDAQEGKCDGVKVDPYAHGCAKVMISGQVRKLEMGTEEYTRGSEAFLSRHPKAASWITSRPTPGSRIQRAHDSFLCKLDISNILVFSGYGGYKSVTAEEFSAQADAVDLNSV